jgi:hypothetical protein
MATQAQNTTLNTFSQLPQVPFLDATGRPSIAWQIYLASLTAGGQEIVENVISTTGTAPLTGFNYAAATNTNVLTIKPAGGLAAGTVTMPVSPAPNQVFRITSTQNITTLTLTAPSGQTVNGAVTTLTANTPVGWVWSASDNNWYRI